MLGLIAAVVFPRFLGADVANAQSNDDTLASNTGAQSDMVRIATYPPGPRLPSTTEFLPRDFVESLPVAIDQYIRDIPPEDNGAPELLDALKVLTSQLAVCFPDSERNEVARIGAINEANINRWHDAYVKDGKLPPPDQLKAFDSSFQRLVEVTRNKELRFFSIAKIEVPMPELEVFRLVTRLCHLRTMALRDQMPIRQRVEEFRAVVRVSRELCDRTMTGRALSLMSLDFVFYTTFQSLLFDRDLDSESARALVNIIADDLRRFEQSQQVQLARAEQMLFLRFLSRVENTSDAHDALLNALNFGKKTEETNLDQKRRDEVIISQLATITPDQLQMNRDAYNKEIQYFLDFVNVDANDWWSRIQTYQVEEQKRVSTLSEGMKAAMESGTLNEHPWLVALFLPPGATALRLHINVGTTQRVALGELALRIADFDGQPESITLAKALGRLNLSDFQVDPYSGRDLKIVERNGRRVVYSIGSDGRDDRAMSMSRERSPGDIFFASESR